MSPGVGLVKLQKVMEKYAYVHYVHVFVFFFYFFISETNYFFQIAFQIGY